MLRLTGKRVETEQSMTEQVPEDLTEAEVADRLEVHRSEDEGARDRASEVDRRDRRGRARPHRLSLPAQVRLRVGTSLLGAGRFRLWSRRPRLGRRAADGQQPIVIETNRTAGEA
jgi:hypothetical protein